MCIRLVPFLLLNSALLSHPYTASGLRRRQAFLARAHTHTLPIIRLLCTVLVIGLSIRILATPSNTILATVNHDYIIYEVREEFLLTRGRLLHMQMNLDMNIKSKRHFKIPRKGFLLDPLHHSLVDWAV